MSSPLGPGGRPEAEERSHGGRDGVTPRGSFAALHGAALVVTALVVSVLVLLPAPALAQPSDAAQAAFRNGLETFAAAQELQTSSPDRREEITERYRAAAEHFRAAWREGATTVAVFANAGNAYYFAGDLGKCVLFYRRALALAPSDPDVQRSLAHVRAELPIQRPQGAATSLVNTLFFWHASFPPRLRRTLFAALFIAGFALLAVSLRRKRPFRVFGLAVLVISIAPLISLLVDAFGASLRREAVVGVEVAGRTGDGKSYSTSHSRPFPAGTEVTIIEERASSAAPGAPDKRWVRVRLLDGSESWIPEGTIERVLRGVEQG